MIINALPSYPYGFESAQALSELLLDGGHDIPRESGDVLAALLAFIVNSRPDDPQWSWSELHDAITAAIDCGESEGRPVDQYLNRWWDLLHSSGLEAAAAAVDDSPYSFSIAAEVRSAIRVVSLHKLLLNEEYEMIKSRTTIQEMALPEGFTPWGFSIDWTVNGPHPDKEGPLEEAGLVLRADMTVRELVEFFDMYPLSAADLAARLVVQATDEDCDLACLEAAVDWLVETIGDRHFSREYVMREAVSYKNFFGAELEL